MRTKHRQRAVMRLALVVMRLHNGPEAQRAAGGRQTRLEAAQFFGVFVHREPPGKESDLPSGRLKSGEELSGDRSDGERSGGDRREPRRIGRVSDDAHNWNVLPRRLPNVRSECRGVARGDDQAVGAVLQGVFEEGGITLAESRGGSEIHVQRRSEGRGGLSNPLAKRVPKERDLTREMHGYPKLLARLQVTGGKVRTVPERLRGAQHPRARHRVDARLPMQCTVDGAR